MIPNSDDWFKAQGDTYKKWNAQREEDAARSSGWVISVVFLIALAALIFGGCGSGATNTPPLECDPGWSAAENDPTLCCPDDAPFATDDDECFFDEDAAFQFDRLREACEVGYSDDQIIEAIQLTEIDFENGFSYAQVSGSVVAQCQADPSCNPQCEADCINCNVAIIDYVYGR